MRETLDAREPARLAAHELVTRYALFTGIAAAANIGCQAGVMRALPAAPIFLSILAGTGIGFVVKYLLDKFWIFRDSYESHGEELRKVAKYGLLSVGTTLLFWGIELAGWRLGGTSEAKYAGAALGLALGNSLKYWLDRRFVFARQPA